MPSRNRIKFYIKDGYYHVYNRGINKQVIFHDSEDYSVFLNLLKRHLSKEPQADKKGRTYVWLHKDLELLAYCLMPNHFHLLIYQYAETALTQLLKQVGMSYTTYYNKKYSRVGPLFQGTYKASLINTDPYLQHISRYIHLNPEDYKTWEYSSIDYYYGKKRAEWLKPTKILDLFDSPKKYFEFLRDYEGHKEAMIDLKSELANI